MIRFALLSLACVGLSAKTADAQITIGRYRVNGTIEIDADLTIEEVVPMTTIPDPIAGWKLDDTTAAYGEFDDLENNNGVAFDTGKFGNAANFVASSSQRLDIPDGPGACAIAGSFTVNAWVRFASLPVNSVRTVLGSTDYRIYVIDGLFGDAILRGQVVSSSGSSTDLQWGTTPSTDEWIHVVFRVRTDTDTVDLFINGVEVDTDTFAGTPRTTATAFSIGGLGSQYHDGAIDELYIFDTALSDAQIAALYNDGDGLELPIAQQATATRPFAQPMIASFPAGF